MIFATVGTPPQPFNRLIKVVDAFAAQTNERVVIQAGATNYEPQHAEYFRWTSSQNMEELTQASRIVIAQASAGAIIMAMKFGKPIIVVPRLKAYGEHFNDHQYQLAYLLNERGQAVLLETLTVVGLQDAINRALIRGAMRSSREELIKGLKSQLDTWQEQIKRSV